MANVVYFYVISTIFTAIKLNNNNFKKNENKHSVLL